MSASKSKKAPILDIGKTGKVSTELLEFDRNNPRLATGNNYSTATDVGLISAYREMAALDELITSICSNGYIDLEPLIVIGPDQGPFRVLEGNRRLSAIKLLKDAELARDCKVSVPRPVPPKVLSDIQSVSAHRVEKEEDAEAFIGFKHINGPHRWDAYAKALFVTNWYKRGKKSGLSIDEIARQTGDTNNTIRAYISSVRVLEQAQANRLFDVNDKHNRGRFAFSHLYTALGRKEYLDYLGLRIGWDQDPSEKPVHKEKLADLGTVLKFMYGSKKDNVEPLVVSQNPDLKNLGRCLANPSALARIKSGDSLTVALSEIDGASMFGEALVIANAKLDRVVELLPKFDGDVDLLSLAEDLLTRADTVKTMMDKAVKRKTTKTAK
ncbi:ParB N-terminal domain-containing protein [Caballeronia sp. LjRoot34]|uniref:ParB N-terminal domain-containing protein n=1 Tax=Caballeronia sp. LjRoot34 TaxID=3342325 RepID=UPI003ED03EC2